MDISAALLALCAGNPLVTSGFPAQRASNAEIWWGVRGNKSHESTKSGYI